MSVLRPCFGPQAADAQLAWLAATVSSAPGKVVILGHIPPAAAIPASEQGYTGGTVPGNVAPGVQLWWQSHIERYNRVVASPKVTFEIFGHIHVDTYFIGRDSSTAAVRPGSGRPPSSVKWVGLSLVASYPPKNGGVRQYRFDPVTKAATDVVQYFYDVEESSRTEQLEWRQSWRASDDASDADGIARISPAHLLNTTTEWRDNVTAHREFQSRA